MFICNFKINSNKFIKYGSVFLCVCIIVLCILAIYKIFGNTLSNNKDSLCEITPNTYTNVLNDVHNDINSYIGKKIKFSGFVYKVYDFSNNQFVLGRNMVISPDFQTVVVGFLCESEEINKFNENSWIEIEGEITKGNYHGEIPIVKVYNIKETEKPNDEFVYPPDEDWIKVGV